MVYEKFCLPDFGRAFFIVGKFFKFGCNFVLVRCK